MGYFYVSNDVTKEPLVKYEFGFNASESKTIINLSHNKQKHQSSFIVIVLHPATSS